MVSAILAVGNNAARLWASAAEGQPLQPSPGLLGLYFLFIGSVLYDSGYVLFAFLESGLVQTFGWLTEQQLIDAINVSAVGLMVVVSIQLGQAALMSWQTWLVFAAALNLAIRWNVNSALLVAGGAIAGWLLMS